MAGKKEEQSQVPEMPETIEVSRENWQGLMQMIAGSVVYMQAAPILQKMQELTQPPQA